MLAAGLTVFLGSLLHGEGPDLDLLRRGEGSSRGHEADGGGAQEAVGSAQRRGTQPAGTGQSTTHSHSARRSLSFPNTQQHSSSAAWHSA